MMSSRFLLGAQMWGREREDVLLAQAEPAALHQGGKSAAPPRSGSIKLRLLVKAP